LQSNVLQQVPDDQSTDFEVAVVNRRRPGRRRRPSASPKGARTDPDRSGVDRSPGGRFGGRLGGLRLLRILLRGEAVLLDLRAQRLARDPERLRGARAVVGDLTQGMLDRPTLDLLETRDAPALEQRSRGAPSERAAPSRADALRQVGQIDLLDM
jgi:hypothetical protein